MGRLIGVDLGTTNSAVAVIEGGEAKIIANAEGANTTPSVVAFAKTGGDILVGTTARRQAVTNVDRTISSVKRHMGQRWNVDIDGKKYSPEEISARILMKLKKDAEAYLGEEVTEAVITVPAYFDNAQREATQQAGKIAGLNVRRIVNEPTAAALAYGLEKAKEDEKILIFDLGGGTFDVSILELGKEDDGFSTLEVVATAGDNQLGGDDWDKAITNFILADFKATSGVDLSGDKIAMQRIVEASEQAKKELSASSSTNITLPYISMSAEGPLNLDVKLTRSKFDEITSGLLERTKKPVEQVLADAKLSLAEIDHVVLVGGSTRMPAVVELVEKLTGKTASKNVNPDEVVALGAALQGAVLTGERRDVLLIDVTPLSLGIRTANDGMTVMIERNTAIPTQRSEKFTTAEDNQGAVTIMVAQGERPVFSGNKLLGQFDLVVPPAPAGVPQIEVTFGLDANGVLDVTAKDLGTGKENHITITGGNSLSDAEVERMVRDAEEHAKEDAVRTANAEALNTAEGLIRQANHLVSEYGDKIPDAEKAEIDADVSALKDAVAKEDYDAVRSGSEKLKKSMETAGGSIYANQNNAGAGTPEDAPTSSASDASTDASANAEDDVVDAEIVDED